MSTTTTTEKKYRTITLTDRPPVRFADRDWPVIANSHYHEWDGEFQPQANREWRGYVRVRQHADGRSIVYAWAWHTTALRGGRGYQQHAGELLEPGADLVSAIHRVHNTINVVYEEGCSIHERWRLLAAECIADLPAEDL